MAIGERRVGKRAEQKRRWDRENKLSRYDLCGCGNHKLRKSDECQTCVDRQVASVRQGIAEMWAHGWTMGRICEELGWTSNHLSKELARMRNAGYDVPHRRTPEQCVRIREARWGRAA